MDLCPKCGEVVMQRQDQSGFCVGDQCDYEFVLNPAWERLRFTPHWNWNWLNIQNYMPADAKPNPNWSRVKGDHE